MDYLKKSFITATLDKAPLEYAVDYTVVDNQKQLELKEAPPAGLELTITRVTSTERIVSFNDASILKMEDLTINQVQQLHILEEAEERLKSNQEADLQIFKEEITEKFDTLETNTLESIEQIKQQTTSDIEAFQGQINTSFDTFSATVNKNVSAIDAKVILSNTTAKDALDRATTALTKAQTAEGQSQNAQTVAIEAKEKAQAAYSLSLDATVNASTAKTAATEAFDIATGIDTKAQNALDNSATALTKAEKAHTTASGIDAKATEALKEAQTATTKAANALITAEGINAKATEALIASNAASIKVDALEERLDATALGDAKTLEGSTKSQLLQQAKEQAALQTDSKIAPAIEALDTKLQTAITTATTDVNAKTLDGSTKEQIIELSKTDVEAIKLKTARTITLTGDVTGTVDFDGTQNVTIQTTQTTSPFNADGKLIFPNGGAFWVD